MLDAEGASIEAAADGGLASTRLRRGTTVAAHAKNAGASNVAAAHASNACCMAAPAPNICAEAYVRHARGLTSSGDGGAYLRRRFASIAFAEPSSSYILLT